LLIRENKQEPRRGNEGQIDRKQAKCALDPELGKAAKTSVARAAPSHGQGDEITAYAKEDEHSGDSEVEDMVLKVIEPIDQSHAKV